MAEKKRPRRTRERILEMSLELFNRHGEPHITTANIADEMNISPGNLYYHFRNKDEIIGELFCAYEARMQPLLPAAAERRVDVEDLWLLLHLRFEQMWAYRFVYRDLDELASRNRRLGARIGALLRASEASMLELCRGMVVSGSMRASEREIAALARNVVLVSTYWMSFDRLSAALPPDADGRERDPDLGRGVYQVLSLVAPFLLGDARALLDRLSRNYL